MKHISRFLGGILALTLIVSAGAWVLTQTVANEHYLVQQSQSAQTADQLAEQLPALLASLTPAPDDTKTILQEAITPGFTRDQIETLLPQLVNYYTAAGAVPQLDLRELDERITGAGYEVPASLATILEQPQAVTAGRLDAPLMTIAHESQQLVWLAPLVAIGLSMLIVGLARQRRWTVLAGSALGGALGTAILAALAYIPPRLISSTLSTSTAEPLTPSVRSLADAVARDQSHRLLWIAAGLAMTALICVLVHFGLRMRQRLGGSKKAHE